MRFKIVILGSLTGILLSCNPKTDQSNVVEHVPEAYEYTGQIIDMHMHTGLPFEVPPGMPSICRPEPCEGDVMATVDPAELLEKTIAAMDRHHISKAFLSGVDWSLVQEWGETATDRFILSPFILQPEYAELEKLRQAYTSGQFKGMGEIGTQLSGIPPNDPSLEPYFQLAEELDIPVLIHTLGIGPHTPNFRSAMGNPVLLEDVLKAHPKLRIYVENAGFPYRDEMIAMMYQYPQLYADVSTITWVIPRSSFYDYLETLITAGLGKRLMFGSDQMVWPEKISSAVESIEQAPFLTEAQKEDIFYNNAARFLRLGGKESGLVGMR
ncbi:amidohydrolase family protein [Echinicola shivajiensis]|uniref:amidohydrolase family protein n=1 Tax=Echinicola shivajiensis TaxID=1035916 RepID=UPI001BFCAB6A|nr:amidohydrolase family protein [Echinicola shivajiensis]